MSSAPASADVGLEMHELMRELFPLPRSLSGAGVRATFDVLEREIPLERTEVASGTPVFDWTVPPEWNIRAAWLDAPDGTRIADFEETNLRVLGYSAPVRGTFALAELRDHLFSDPGRPDVVPFRTSYHHRNWGFCLRHRELESLVDGDYDVCVDSSLEDGSVTYAESVVPGRSEEEVLVSTYVDHPSLANDNLSGVVLVAALAKAQRGRDLRYTYRFLFGPATIGPLLWLAANEPRLGRVRHGLVACCAGDPGRLTYKRSRRGDADVDRAVEHVLRRSGAEHEVRDFSPLGGDERQFCSPGFDLPVGVLSRTPPDEFPEYHSSADDLELVRPEALADTFERYLEVFEVLEGNGTYVNLSPKGEPQLGKRGLYRTIGGGSFAEAPLLWVLNLSDGEHDLLEIATRSGLSFPAVRDAAAALEGAGLLAPA
jgi:aminopeptidase-like protein